ncbi:hypothetical protein BDV95DRAFT_581223 [Massariosphaeria phaeospora]|uniref:Snf7 family n=1 Tax=Massariosphaeria phaeospora TaxID=100035 RepID=A0A7C8M4J7_9PLEO|nr:hypothetical protein BDV95DRAFT_581223 [Massariosphaeria phaeospora]
MAGLENTVMQLKFTVKQLNRQSNRAGKDELAEKRKVERALKQGQPDIARIYADNAIRKQDEKLDLLRLAGRVDAVASKLSTAATMRTISQGIAKATRSLEIASKQMSPERIVGVMEKFEEEVQKMDVNAEMMQNAAKDSTNKTASIDAVDALMNKAADKVGVELQQDLDAATPAKTQLGHTGLDEEAFQQRLRALRN